MTAFREALKTQLASALSITFVEGELPGPIEGEDLACIFPAREQERREQVQVENLTVVVRVFKAYVAPNSPKVPNHDPDALEALAALLKASIRGAQKDVGGTWFHRVVSIEYDMRRNAFEAIITGWQKNAAVIP